MNWMTREIQSMALLFNMAVLWMSYFPFTALSMASNKSQNSVANLQGDYMNSTILLKRLLDGYDRRIRPGLKGVPSLVKVDMYVSNIWAIQEVNMDFTIDIYLRQYWNDERLRYDDFASTHLLTLSSDINKQIWVPSTYFVGAKKAYFHDVTTDNYLLQIRPDGNIFYSIRLTITTSCQMNLRKFPHDTQECTLALESYGYQATDVLYAWNDRDDNTSAIYLHDDLELPQFEVIDVTKVAKMNLYNIGPHSALIAIFKMKRRIGYFLIDTYIPSTIIVIISWISFWIDPETAPARVALGITTVLTMTTLISSARANLPKVSYVKAIDWYLLLCLIFVFGSILEYTCVTFVIARRKRSQKRMEIRKGQRNSPNNKEHQIDRYDSPTYRVHNKTGSKTDVLNKVFGRGQSHRPVENNKNDDHNILETIAYRIDPALIDNCSRLLFPLTFMAFNMVYWIVYG